jgi:hypothetical protein
LIEYTNSDIIHIHAGFLFYFFRAFSPAPAIMQSIRASKAGNVKRAKGGSGSGSGSGNGSGSGVAPIAHGVAFYTVPPTFDVNLAQFEALAIERLGACI